MTIPGTKKVDVSQVTPGCVPNELFYFCINQLSSGAYLNDFLRQLDEFLPLFIFSREAYDLHLTHYSTGKTLKTPLDRAREFLKTTKADRTSDSGEFGEFLLYLFTKEVKGAKKIVSKIQTRGSRGVNIHGRDGIFMLKDDDGEIYMLLGEAKVKPDSNDGLREAQSDTNNFWDSGSIKHEVNLASTHLRSELTEDNADIYETYFIDDNPQHANLKYKNVIFVGYNLPAFTSLVNRTIDFSVFQSQVSADLQRCFNNQAGLIDNCPHSNIYCFMPFECVNSARIAFAQHNQLIV